jgi:HD superfamily phosphohydrolase
MPRSGSNNLSRSQIVTFQVGDTLANKYKIISRNDEPAGQRAIPLGEGGSGVIYLAEQTLYENIVVKRAVKFFVLRDDIATMTHHKDSGPISATGFRDEIVNIGNLQHENLIKVIETGYWRSPNIDQNVPFIVMELIEGETLRNLIEQNKIRELLMDNLELTVDLILQIIHGIDYLHRRNFYHCDIATKNIFLRIVDNYRSIVIGDLGIGRTVTPNDPELDTKKVFVAGTRDYCPPEVQAVLNTEISLRQFARLQPQWDIFALIKCSMELAESVNKQFDGKISWLNGLTQLLTESIRKPRFSDLKSLEDWIAWFHPRQRMIGGVPELSDNFSGRLIILLPVESVTASQRIRALYHHKALLRLKHVPQLVMSSAVFPSANHTRYEHSLGTYQTMRRYLIALIEDDAFLSIFSPSTCELALICALLSNLTRFPFSTIVHELHTPGEGLFQTFSRYHILNELFEWDDEKSGRFSKCLEANFPHVDIESVKGILTNEISGNNLSERLIYFMLNSSLDARVIDYIRRDSLHLGISHADTIDLGDLFNHICIHETQLVIRSTGLSTVEQLISLRYWLFNRVYWNNPNRSLISMLRYVIYLLLRNDDTFENKFRQIALVKSQEEILQFFKAHSQERNLRNCVQICDLLLQDRPIVFKECFQINRSESEAQGSLICDRASQLKIGALISLQDELNTIISKSLSIDPSNTNILIDIPIEVGKQKFGEDINVLTHSNHLVRLETLSGIVAGAKRGFSEHLQRFRVFMSPWCEREIRANLNQVIRTIQDFLSVNL